MAEFKWHLMADEVPEYGMKDYLVMGPKGGLKIARGYHEGFNGPLGAHFHRNKNGFGIIADEEAYAWAEIPPLEVTP